MQELHSPPPPPVTGMGLMGSYRYIAIIWGLQWEWNWDKKSGKVARKHCKQRGPIVACDQGSRWGHQCSETVLTGNFSIKVWVALPGCEPLPPVAGNKWLIYWTSETWWNCEKCRSSTVISLNKVFNGSCKVVQARHKILITRRLETFLTYTIPEQDSQPGRNLPPENSWQNNTAGPVLPE